MTVDDNMILYMPSLDKNYLTAEIIEDINQLKIGKVKDIKIVNGIVENVATIYLHWNRNYYTEFIQKLINTKKKQYYIYSSNGKQYSIFNLNTFAASQNIEKYLDIQKYLDIEKNKLLKNSSCCGQISQGWQPSHPSTK